VCNGETLAAFLPGRNITRVHWEPGRKTDFFTNEPEFADDLVAELSNLRALSLGGYWGRAHLVMVSQHLKALQFLELIGPYDERVSHLPIITCCHLKLIGCFIDHRASQSSGSLYDAALWRCWGSIQYAQPC